jgi:radical SAM superfamily enzyme YgiQ (UPF0313 family)
LKPNVLFVNLPSIPYEEILKSVKGENKIPQLNIKKYSDVGEVGLLDYSLDIENVDWFLDINSFIRCLTKDVKFKPDIIAISLIFTSAYTFYNECVKELRKIYPEAIIAVGGTHASNSVVDLLRNKDIDLVIKGEGEKGFADFINNFPNVSGIKGIYTRYKDERPLENCEYIMDLDTIPFPDWELIDMEAYTGAVGQRRSIGESKEQKLATVMTTRGCPFKCTYCSSHTVHGRRLRYRSVENVIEEMKYLYEKYGVTLFFLMDDLFTASTKRTVELLKEIDKLEIDGIRLQFPNALSVNTMTDDVIDAMIETGTDVVNIAVESGSRYTQKHIIKKNVDLDKAKKVVKKFQDKGVYVRCYFIFGFPTETKELMYETIEYIKWLGADWTTFTIAAPLIGSEMYQQFVDLGYISRNDVEVWSKTIYQDRQFDTKEITAKELKKLSYRANLECNFINNPNKVWGRYEKAIEIYEDVLVKYPFHIVSLYCIAECFRKLEQHNKAQLVIEKINKLISSDKRAKEMYDKHHDLMPNISSIRGD